MKHLAILALVLGYAAPARCELVLLGNGSVLHVDARRLGAGCVELTLRDGGSVCLAGAQIRAFYPDAGATPMPAADDLDVAGLVERAARRHGVDPALVLSVIAVESAFAADAVSPKGASGLMQLMPATADELGVGDVFDPAQNVDAGSRYLATLLRRYGGDVERSLAAYNAGPAAVARHGGVPPYRETRRYVRAVLDRYQDGSSP